jgi:integrase
MTNALNTSFGIKKRREKKIAEQENQRILIKKYVEYLISEKLPSIESSDLSDEDYQKGLKVIVEDIIASYKYEREFRIARFYLSKIIQDGNDELKWNLDVPQMPVKIVPPKNTRTIDWFQVASKVSTMYFDVNKKIFTLNRPLGADEMLAMTMLSSIVNGGLAIAEGVVALGKLLLSETHFIHRVDDLVWIDLTAEFTSLDNNEINSTTSRRWYIDPSTLFWITAFRRSSEPVTSLIWDANHILKMFSETYDSVVGKKYDMPTKSLTKFCKSALAVTEALPGVYLDQATIELAKGSQKGSSLPSVNVRYMMMESGGFPELTRLSYQSFDSIDYKNFVRLSERKLKSGEFNSLIKSISETLKIKSSEGKRKSKLNAINILKKLLDDYQEKMMVVWLLEWFIELFVKYDNKISTVQRYFNAVGKVWLSETVDLDLEIWDENSFIEHYYAMLDLNKSDKSRKFSEARFKQLHEFGVRKYNAPFIHGFSSVRGKVSVKASYISPVMYRRSLEYIDAMIDTDDLLRIMALRCIIILAYRTGMRLGEILKLKQTDIEFSSDSWCTIKNNAYGTNKSSSALRQLPLEVMLEPSELSELNRYITNTRNSTKNNKQSLMFFESGSTIPLSANKVSQIVTSIFDHMTGGEIRFTFHSLRHSALNNLYLIFTESNLASILDIYTREKCIPIKRTFLSKNKNDKDTYWVLAGIAGHATPETTMSSYIHLFDYHLYESIRGQKNSISDKVIQNILGLTKTKITRTKNELSISKDCDFLLYELQSVFIDTLPKNIFVRKIKNLKNSSAQHAHTKNEQNTNIFKLLDISLSAYQDGQSIKQIAQNIEYLYPDYRDGKRNAEVDFNKWLAQAKKLSNLITRSNKSRLFSDRKSNVRGEHLLPTKPSSNSDVVDAHAGVNKLRKMYKEDEYKQKINQLIKHFIKTSNTSNSGLKFKKIQQLSDAIEVLVAAFNVKRIYVELDVDRKNLKQWKSVIPKFCKLKIKSDTEKHTNTGKLYLRHKSESSYIKDNGNNWNKYSAKSLRYILHMLAILIVESNGST